MSQGGFKAGAGRPRKHPKKEPSGLGRGRPKGGKNKPKFDGQVLDAKEMPTSLIHEYAKTSRKKSPLEFLLNLVNDETKELADRMRAASVILPFMHAKIGEKGKKDSVQDSANEVATSGTFATPESPSLQNKH